MQRLSLILKVLLAWSPFFVGWVLFVLGFGGGRVSVLEAIDSGAVAMGSAAALGFFVWRFTGRFPWPDGVNLRFYAVHLLAGVVYALLWTVITDAIAFLTEDISSEQFWAEARMVIWWQLLMGLWIYGGVASVSHALRIRARLREQESIAARAQALAAQAQLAALRAQLNPHFLFNALHSLSYLVQEDPEEAESAIDQLGGLLRYALDEGENDEVLLMDEWAFTSAYLDLESIRFGSRLRVQVEIEADAMACPVPPFSVQPLVENAVRHGIDPRPEGGVIAIAAEVSDERLKVVVNDDGPGASGPEAVAKGHGLGDLRQRLEALYGSDAEVSVDTGPGRGFQVTLSLPAEPQEIADVAETGEAGTDVDPASEPAARGAAS